jgi:hypothetical protein
MLLLLFNYQRTKGYKDTWDNTRRRYIARTRDEEDSKVRHNDQHCEDQLYCEEEWRTGLLTWDDSMLYNSKLLNDEYYWTCMHPKSPASHTAINSVRTSVIVRKILTWGQLALWKNQRNEDKGLCQGCRITGHHTTICSTRTRDIEEDWWRIFYVGRQRVWQQLGRHTAKGGNIPQFYKDKESREDNGYADDTDVGRLSITQQSNVWRQDIIQ